jgi:hypothetical protein
MNIKKYLIWSMTVVAALNMTSCFEDNLASGPVVPVSLTIIVDNGSESAVSGASVELYNNLDDYIAETNPIGTATTDAGGQVTFDASALGTEATKFYFNVASGTQRNWNFTSSTPVMTLTNGATRITTSIGDLPPGFVYLTSNTFVLTAYSYSGSGFVLDDNVFPACENDDRVEFKKDGSVWRFDASNKCNPPSDFQLPLYDVNGAAFSTWGLSSDGTEIEIRDFDPYWDSSNIEVTGGLEIDEVSGSVIIAYGGPYNVRMDKM